MAAPALTVPPFTPPSYAVGAAAQSTFAFAFPFWDPADVLVYVGTALLDPSLYTVTGFNQQAGQQVSGGYGSGQVVLNTAVANATVIVDRYVNPARNTVYGSGQPIPVSSLNADFSRLVAMVQDQGRLLGKLNPQNIAATITSVVQYLLAAENVVVAETGSGT